MFVIIVDVAFQFYFECFEVEGVLWGLYIQLVVEQIGVVFLDELVVGQVGLCIQYILGISIIEIRVMIWLVVGDLEWEYLIFYELGYCYLGRLYDDVKDIVGFCFSIMQSGDGSCCYNYWNVIWVVYLDELFG